MVLVTGGAGYIGSAVLALLRHLGIDHVAMDNLEYGRREAVRTSPFVRGDVRCASDLDRVFGAFPISAVIHLAAYISVTESLVEPARYFENNTGGTYHLLEAMLRHGIQRIVFSSTAAVYGLPEYTPVDETHALCPSNPYGHSKLAAERLLAGYAAEGKMHVIRLRYFNAAGALPAQALGPSLATRTDLITRAFRVGLGLEAGLELYGVDYPTADGTCVRDFVHIADLAEAHIAALRQLDQLPPITTFNLGTGVGYSVREIVHGVQQAMGQKLAVVSTDRRVGDPHTVVASAQSAREMLGWKPKRTQLTDILGDTWQYYQESRSVRDAIA